MTPVEFHQLVQRIQDEARSWPGPVGRFQNLRKRVRGLKRGKADIFQFGPRGSVHETYAFHYGGRSELQLNIGIESNGTWLHYGLALSFEPSKSLQDPVGTLRPVVARFNELVHAKPWALETLPHRYWVQGRGGEDRPLPEGPLSDRVCQEGNFIFLGKRQRPDEVTPNLVLKLWDSILPLWAHVQGGPSQIVPPAGQSRPSFIPSPPPSQQVEPSKRMTREAEILLNQEHKEIQLALYRLLVAELGAENVDTEQHIPGVGYVDVAARSSGIWTYYEIKVAQDLKSCFRQALGQLLEYGHWDHSGRCDRMVIVSRFPLDDDGEGYLELLRRKYNLPLDYRQVTVQPGPG